jgi:hypothetical protein
LPSPSGVTIERGAGAAWGSTVDSQESRGGAERMRRRWTKEVGSRDSDQIIRYVVLANSNKQPEIAKEE